MGDNMEISLDHLVSEWAITGILPCSWLTAATHACLNGYTPVA
jgi:hypothetical protein